MEKHQSIKRLGYGFSALVMALSATAFVPSFSNAAYAEDVACTTTAHLESSIREAIDVNDAVICLDSTLELTSKLNITKNVTIDLNGNKIVQTSLDTIFKVTGELTIIDSVGGGSITAHDGKGITGTGSTGTINVKSGTFNGKFNKADAGILNVTGGVFDYEVAPADGYYTYVLDEEAGTYYVTTKLSVYPAVTSDTVSVNKTRNIATYSIVKDYEGEEMKPEIVVTLNDAEAAEEDYELSYGVYNTERNVVAATLNKVGRYVFSIKDAAGVTKRVTLNAYEVAEENIDGKSYDLAIGDEKKDVTADLGVNPISAIKEVTSDADAVATAEVAEGKLLVTPANAGTANITVTLEGRTVKELTFTVNVFDTADAAEYVKAGAEKTFGYVNTWTSAEVADESIATIVEDEDGNIAGVKGVAAGETIVTLKNGELEKKVTISVYELADSYVLSLDTDSVSEMKYDNANIVKLPNSDWTVTAEPSFPNSNAVMEWSNGLFVVKTAGQRNFKYTIKDADDNVVVNGRTVRVYVYGESTEIEDQTVMLEHELDFASLYETKANSSSVVTYTVEGDGATITEDGVFSSTKVGEKTVTITETLAGKTIAEQTVTMTVTGIEVEPVEFFAGETGTWTVAAEGVTIDTEDITTNTNLTVTSVDGGFEFTAIKAGAYTVVYGLENSDETIEQTVTVYNKVAVSDEDLTIDLVEGSTDTGASFKVIGDGDITVEAEDGLTAGETNPAAGEGAYKFTAEEAGEYEVKISQKVGDNLTAEKILTVKVTDSTVTDPTNPTDPTDPTDPEEPGEEDEITGIDATISKDTIKVSETAKITPSAIGGEYDGEYAYEVNGGWASYYVEVTEDGTVSVKEGLLTSTDQTVTITVSAGESAKELTLTIKANFSYEFDAYDVILGDGQTFVKGKDTTLTFKIDAPFSKFDTNSVVVYNKTLWDKAETEELTDEELSAAMGYWLVAGEDFTVKEGSTVITLTDTFMAKLLDGEHVLSVSYYDDSNVDAITRKYVETTFTVTDVATPDTGAYTGEGTSATANIATAFVSAVSAIALAGAATIRKMFRK